ncbi:hypothetical protein PybrP1_002901 [[Pythium] brassicae (nom. inval.)]|nr:hypothetical protein PybrP1_002901 [[Pythium] brassicae (nom. inval.)]
MVKPTAPIRAQDNTQHLKLDSRGDGMYSGTFRWLESKRFLELPARSVPLDPTSLTGGWETLLSVRCDPGDRLMESVVQDPSCLDALSFPVTLAHTAQQLGLWRQTDESKHVLVIGASCKAEQRVWHITDYWHELSLFFPHTDITLWFIGPEVREDGQDKQHRASAKLRARHFRGTFGAFQNAHASHECTYENAIIVGYNTGFGNFVDSNHFGLLFSWLPDLYRVADSKVPAIFTCANDYADMNGEFAVQSRVIGAKMLLLPQQNPFSCVSHLHEEGRRDTAWSRGNSFLYAVQGCDLSRRVEIVSGNTSALQKRLDAELDLHLEDVLGRHFFRGTVLSKEQAARCEALTGRKLRPSKPKLRKNSTGFASDPPPALEKPEFLNMKGWHPSNKTNQRRIWIAEQSARDHEQREQEAAAEVRQSAEQQRFQEMAVTASGDPAAARRAAAAQQLSFMYAPPPGLPKPSDAAASAEAEEEEGDAAVAEFRRKVDRKRKGDAAAEDPREGQRNLERYVGRRPDENLTIKAQVERFPFLKDAPVEGQYTDAVKVNFKPMGKQLRNVRCMRCGEWGHQSGDRECALRDANPHDAARQLLEDPMAQLAQKKRELVLRKAALPLEMQEVPGKEEFEILLSDEEDDQSSSDAEREFLAKLSAKEKKKLLKRLKHTTPPFERVANAPVRIYPPEGPRVSPVLQALQSVNKVVAVVGVLSASYESSERAFAFANRLIGRNAFQPAAMAATCTAAKDAAPLLASVHLFYDEARSCAYLLGVARPESQCFDRDAADVAAFERERFKVQLLLHACCNVLFVLQETARLPISLLKDARALAAEKQQVLAQLQSAPAASAKGPKKSGPAAAASVFAPGRCVPLVLFVVPAPDELQAASAAKSSSGKPRAPLAAYCKAFEGKLTSLFRSLRAGLVGSVRMRDALTATNLSKERRVFNLDPSHCAVVVSARTATEAGALDVRLQDLFDSLEVDFDSSADLDGSADLDSLLQPLEDDDVGFPRAAQVLTRFVDMLLAAAGSVASAPPASSGAGGGGGGNKDGVRVDLLTLAHWLKAFYALVKTMHRMDAKRRQDAAALQQGEHALLYQYDHTDFL